MTDKTTIEATGTVLVSGLRMATDAVVAAVERGSFAQLGSVLAQTRDWLDRQEETLGTALLEEARQKGR